MSACGPVQSPVFVKYKLVKPINNLPLQYIFPERKYSSYYYMTLGDVANFAKISKILRIGLEHFKLKHKTNVMKHKMFSTNYIS